MRALLDIGYDRDAGTIDLLIRFDDKGGHCQAHRHMRDWRAQDSAGLETTR